MTRLILLLLAIATLCRAEPAEITINPTSVWHEADASLREQFAKIGTHAILLDVAYVKKGVAASTYKYVIDSNHPREAYDNCFAGVVGGAEKKGFHLIATKTLQEPPFPRKGTLLEIRPNELVYRILVLSTFSENNGYIIILVGDQSLDFSSELLQSYSRRIIFSNPTSLNTTGPKSKLVVAWEEGNRTGQIMITLVLLIVGLIFFFRWQGTRQSNPDS